ncbi:MAG: VOC family protein [Chloroflexota bacterium]|nr:VOC family protein [Chloroflexota bacterium]
MITGHYHTSFTVSDLERSIAFYTEKLGFRVDRRAEAKGAAIEQVIGIPGAHLLIAHLLLGDFDLELIQYMAPPGVKLDTRTSNVGAAHIAFYTDDLMKAYQEMKAQGVRFLGSVTEGGPRGVYFQDPDGVALELVQQR